MPGLISGGPVNPSFTIGPYRVVCSMVHAILEVRPSAQERGGADSHGRMDHREEYSTIQVNSSLMSWRAAAAYLIRWSAYLSHVPCTLALDPIAERSIGSRDRSSGDGCSNGNRAPAGRSFRPLRPGRSPGAAAPPRSRPRIAGSSIVAGTLYCLPSAMLFMVPRRILPERVLGRRATAATSLNAATGPICSRTRWISSALRSRPPAGRRPP